MNITAMQRRKLALIAVIVVLRHYLVQGVTRQNAGLGIAAILAVGLLFFVAQFWGSLAVPEAEFVQYLQGRMTDPSRGNLLSFSFIWYQSLAQEIHDTWQRMPSNLLGVPVFALLIWLCLLYTSPSPRDRTRSRMPSSA